MKTKITEILKEAAGDTLFRDAHANIDTDLDTLLSGGIEESCEKAIEEAPRRDWKARTKSFLNNDLFVDFDDPADEAAVTDLSESISKSEWDTLIEEADKLLDDLIHVTKNTDYDDGDGYWEEEGVEWCMRYLYYSDKLKSAVKLEKLCDEYSKRLPNVEFYYIEDADDEISEIGYTARQA